MAHCNHEIAFEIWKNIIGSFVLSVLNYVVLRIQSVYFATFVDAMLCATSTVQS